jgi:hypothetical protein
VKRTLTENEKAAIVEKYQALARAEGRHETVHVADVTNDNGEPIILGTVSVEKNGHKSGHTSRLQVIAGTVDVR